MQFAYCILSTGSAESSARSASIATWSGSQCLPQAMDSATRKLMSSQIPPSEVPLRGQEEEIFIDFINTIGNLRSQSWKKRGVRAGDDGICWGWDMTWEKPAESRLRLWSGQGTVPGFILFILLISWVNPQASFAVLCTPWGSSRQPLLLLSFPKI